MHFSSEQLIGLAVETRGGDQLGYVKEIEIDVEQQVVHSYVVRPSLITRPFSKELRIASTEVVEITKNKIIVEDTVIRSGAPDIVPVVD